MTIKHSETSMYLLKRLYKEFISVYIGKMVIAGLLMILAAICTALNAWLLQPVIDDIFTNKNASMLIWIVLAVMSVTFINAIANYGQSFLMRCVGQKIVVDMQMTLYQHLLGADLAYYGKGASGKIISRFTNDIQILRNSVSIVIVGFIKEALTFVCLVGVMFYQSVPLSLMVFIAFPLAVYPILRLGKRMRKISHGIQEELGEFTTRLDETFKGIRVIKAYQQEKKEASYANEVLQRLYQLYVKAAKVQSLASPIMEAFAGIAIAAVIFYGGSLVIEGVTTSGKFISFLAAVLMTYKPLKTLSSMNTVWHEGLASAVRLFDLLDEKPTITNVAHAVPFKSTKPCTIGFHDMYFSYASQKDALKKFNLTVKAGKTVALVGSSGAGKSTVMNLLLRFYEPQEGTITLDGENIKHFTIETTRKAMAMVSQETFLFDGTVAENIAYGRPGAHMEDIIQAAKTAAADEFIQELPEQYQTLIGELGSRLSGGQRQRIAIARAILRDAPILLLDEATSALDSISEKKIKQALDRLRQGRTTLVIAHRLSTVINADMICVLKKGQIIEQGTHEELLIKGKEYKKLYQVLED